MSAMETSICKLVRREAVPRRLAADEPAHRFGAARRLFCGGAPFGFAQGKEAPPFHGTPFGATARGSPAFRVIAGGMATGLFALDC